MERVDYDDECYKLDDDYQPLHKITKNNGYDNKINLEKADEFNGNEYKNNVLKDAVFDILNKAQEQNTKSMNDLTEIINRLNDEKEELKREIEEMKEDERKVGFCEVFGVFMAVMTGLAVGLVASK